MTEREIFFEALEMATAEARAAYLQGACGRDVTLRRKVDELLKEHFSNDSLLAGPALEGQRVAVAESKAEEAPAQMIGRYKLLEKLGEGGFGEVWMAEQREPVKRRVALKIVKPGMDSRQVVARFEAERQALAMMDHANIAKVFDAGVTDKGLPYFVMELVRGIKITEYCDQNQLPTQERLSLFILVCQAIQHAHQKGIIHRDIKPSNILVTLHDGVPVPKVIDFGIAKATQGELTDKTVFTQFQQFIGTPAYISPEQAEMSGLDIDTRADIYSLGVLLYELLVGQTPFDAKEMIQGGLDALRQIIREKEPLRPSTKLNTLAGDARTTAGKRRQTDVGKLVHQLQGDLDWIVMKCLEKDRTRRYDTANGLAADIKRHLANEPILARPVSQVEKVWRWCRRKPLVASLSATTLILLLSVAIGSPIALYHINQERKRAEASLEKEAASRHRAETAEGEMEQQLYAALLEQGRATILSGEMGQRFRALDAVQRAAGISNSAELRGVAIAALALPDLRFERELAAPPNVWVAKLDPAFERIALGAGNRPVEIRSVSDHRLLATLPASTNRPISDFGLWSRDGRFFAVSRGYESGRSVEVEVWNVASATRVLLVHASSAVPMSFHPRLPRIMVWRAPAAAVTWDLESGLEISTQQLEGRPRVLKFAPDGEALVAVHDVGHQSQVTIHPNQDGVSGASRLFTNYVHEITWHPSGDWLALGDNKGRVQGMNAQTGETHLLGHHKSDVTVLEFSPDGKYLFSGGWDLEVICWNVEAMRREFAVLLNSHHVQFRADGRQCAIRRAGPETRVQLCAFEPPALHREFAEDLGGPRGSAAFSRDGRWLAACGDERLVVWDLNSQGPGAVMSGIPDTRVSFAANGELFINPRGGCFRYRPAPGTNAASPPKMRRLDLAKPAGMFSFCLVSNGLVFTGTNGSTRATFDRLADENTHWAPTISGLNGVSPDERWLAMFRFFGTDLYIHRLPDLEPVAKLTNEYRIDHFEFSPLGDEVAVGNLKGVEFWSTTTWQRTRHLTNFTGVLYSPDARTFWLSTQYRDAGLHDARKADLLLPLPPNTRPLALSPDGRQLAVTVNSRRVQVWDLAEVRLRLRELGLDWASNR